MRLRGQVAAREERARASSSEGDAEQRAARPAKETMEVSFASVVGVFSSRLSDLICNSPIMMSDRGAWPGPAGPGVPRRRARGSRTSTSPQAMFVRFQAGEICVPTATKMEGTWRWAIIVGGAGAAVATLVLLVDYESKRQRRFDAGQGSKHRGIDKKAVKKAVSASLESEKLTHLEAHMGHSKKQQSSEMLAKLLPKTFFADPVSEESSPKIAGGPGWWAQLRLRVKNSSLVLGLGRASLAPQFRV